MAATSANPIIDRTLHQRHLLRLGIHVLYGCRICSGFPRRPYHVHQRTRQWSVWRCSVHDCEFSDRVALFIPHIPCVLTDNLLPQQLPANSWSVLHMGDVAIPGSTRWRVSGCPCVLHLPDLCRRSSSHRIRKWSMDERRRIFSLSGDPKSILEIRLSLY